MIAGPVVAAGPVTAIGLDGGTLFLNGSVSQTGNLTVTGPGNLTVNGAVTGQGSAPGLLESQAPGNVFTAVQTAANLINYGFDAQLSPFMGTTSAAVPTTYGYYPTAQHVWSNTDTWLYQGYVNVPNFNNTGLGYISFAKAFDDGVRISIDGATTPYALSSNSFNTSLGSGELTLTAGWHALDIRLANGGGARGPTVPTPTAGRVSSREAPPATIPAAAMVSSTVLTMAPTIPWAIPPAPAMRPTTWFRWIRALAASLPMRSPL